MEEAEYVAWQRGGGGGGNYHPPPLPSMARTVTAIIKFQSDLWTGYIFGYVGKTSLLPESLYLFKTRVWVCNLYQMSLDSDRHRFMNVAEEN